MGYSCYSPFVFFSHEKVYSPLSVTTKRHFIGGAAAKPLLRIMRMWLPPLPLLLLSSGLFLNLKTPHRKKGGRCYSLSLITFNSWENDYPHLHPFYVMVCFLLETNVHLLLLAFWLFLLLYSCQNFIASPTLWKHSIFFGLILLMRKIYVCVSTTLESYLLRYDKNNNNILNMPVTYFPIAYAHERIIFYCSACACV